MENLNIKHLGIIMDGNRRWAKKNNFPPLIGHKYGHDTFLKVGDWCLDRGIKILTIWVFSRENWKRTREEINYLMDLLRYGLKNDVPNLHKKGVRMKFLGRLNDIPEDLRIKIIEAETLTKDNKKGTLNVALSYGGQMEITDAVNKIINAGIKEVTPETFQEYLYDPKLPPPDLVIRTSGEMRTSGFLLWQSAYSELFFSQTLWPDFSEQDLDEALDDYRRRQRRFGK